MDRISRTRIADLAAAKIRDELLGGLWKDRLPGTRILARRLGVSAPSVSEALAILVKEGVIERRGERKSFRPVSSLGGGAPATQAQPEKRLLILTHEPLGQLVEVSRRLIEMLRDEMAAKGWKVESQVLDFLHVAHPQKSWDRLIQVDSGTSVVALYGRKALAEWALRRKVRMIFLGGNTESLEFPMVAVRSAGMAEFALRKLTALGHQRIVIPLCDRAEAFKQSIREVTRKAVEDAGGSYVKSYHNPESTYLKTDVTWRIIERVFQANPPTAFVFLDWKELVTAQCFLSRLGLRVPEDISLVLLSDQTDAEWFHPPLTRFRFPVARIVRTLVKWLEDGKNDVRNLTSDFIEGQSIAPPRRETRTRR